MGLEVVHYVPKIVSFPRFVPAALFIGLALTPAANVLSGTLCCALWIECM